VKNLRGLGNAESDGGVHDPVAVAQARQKVQSISSGAVLRPLSDALCDPARLKIVVALSACRLSVKDLSSVINRSQSTTSQHLRVLRSIQAVHQTRDGRKTYYELARDGLGPRIASLITALERAAS
jgi:DNA-binding transcriptional ArsR family regulator